MPSPVTHITLGDGGPNNTAPMHMPDGSVRTPTSFGDYGLPEDSVDGRFNPGELYHSRRSLRLRYNESFYRCTQHDGKGYDWDGNGVASAESIRTTPSFIGGTPSASYIPLSGRRPATPYRLGRQVVKSFTAFLLGQGRWPQMRSKDEQTQAASEELIKAGGVIARVLKARNFGGSSGTAGLSWCFVDGKPKTRAHNGADIHVLSWIDEDECIPAHVIELKIKTRVALDPEDNQLKPAQFWQRRDWTMQADVVFKPVRVVSKEPPVWEVDNDASYVHGDEECHFVWVQNLPSEDDSEDGQPDYAETYDQQNGLDVLNSSNFKGVNLNLDPTLVVHVTEDQEFDTIKKGSENAIVFRGPTGQADYLQLKDTAVGKETITLQRQQILEVTGCVLPDPDKAAAAAASGEAQKMVYATMIAQTDVLRLQWGPAIERLVNQMLRSWRRLRETPVEVPVNDNAAETDEAPVFEEALPDLMLEPRQIRAPGLDGKEVVTETPHDPGAGEVSVEWGPYFKPTGTEKQAVTGSISSATGGKPILSQRSAVELTANLYDRDANEEWQAIQDEAQKKLETEEGMFAGTGGEVDGSAAGENAADNNAAAGTIELAPTDKVAVMTVNEVRDTLKVGPLLNPDGSPHPDGDMLFLEYKARIEAAAKEPVDELPSPEGQDDLPLPEAPPSLLGE